MYEKYAFIAAGIGAYTEARPVSGNVPPIVIVRAVIPSSLAADVALDAPTPSATTSRAAAKSTTFLIRTPFGDGAMRGEPNPAARFANTETARADAG